MLQEGLSLEKPCSSKIVCPVSARCSSSEYLGLQARYMLAQGSREYGEYMSAELQRLQAKQLSRLHEAAEAAGVNLGSGWIAEVKVRQQGTTAGTMHR